MSQRWDLLIRDALLFDGTGAALVANGRAV